MTLSVQDTQNLKDQIEVKKQVKQETQANRGRRFSGAYACRVHSLVKWRTHSKQSSLAFISSINMYDLTLPKVEYEHQIQAALYLPCPDA